MAATGRESFPCQYLCGKCGWLADLDDDPCPGCGRVMWIDLSHITTAEALRAHERANPPLAIRHERLMNVGLAALFLAWSAIGIALTALVIPVLGGLAAVITGGLLVQNLREQLVDALSHRAKARLPARRRLPLPPAVGVVGNIRGQATSESVLRSPIGDLPCLAWRVRAALRDLSSDGGLTIDDSRSAAFELAGHRFEADGVELPEAGEFVELSKLDADARDRVVRFLRARGCFSHEGDWVLEERCIPLARPVVVEGRGDRSAPALRCDEDAAGSPYR
jgi:hypothetical protein